MTFRRRKTGSLNASLILGTLPGNCRRVAGQSVSRDVESPEAHFIGCHLFCVFNKLFILEQFSIYRSIVKLVQRAPIHCTLCFLYY